MLWAYWGKHSLHIDELWQWRVCPNISNSQFSMAIVAPAVNLRN